MIAGLSIPTTATSEAMILAQMNRATEGLSGKRFIGSGGFIDAIEDLAVTRACKLFGFDCANVQVNSGTQANLAVQQAVCEVGDTILSMDLSHGGHLSHGFPHSLSGKLFKVIRYGLRPDGSQIDLDSVRSLAKKHRPKLIIAGTSSYPRRIDYSEFAAIASEIGSYLLLDISHPAGLIAAGIIDIPKLPHVIVSFTTEKTLCGPRGGTILSSRELKKKINRAVFPCLQSSFAVSAIAGKAAIFEEARQNEFQELQKQIIRNAKIFAGKLLELGLKLLTEGTDTHIIVANLSGHNVSGKDAEELLLSTNIMANRQLIPADTLEATAASGIRFGTTCLTIRNISEPDLSFLAEQIFKIICNKKVSKAVEMNIKELIMRQSRNVTNALFR